MTEGHIHPTLQRRFKNNHPQYCLLNDMRTHSPNLTEKIKKQSPTVVPFKWHEDTFTQPYREDLKTITHSTAFQMTGGHIHPTLQRRFKNNHPQYCLLNDMRTHSPNLTEKIKKQSPTVLPFKWHEDTFTQPYREDLKTITHSTAFQMTGGHIHPTLQRRFKNNHPR